MKIVFLDAKSVGDDVDMSGLKKLGELIQYDFTVEQEVAERVKDADVIIVNKVPINRNNICDARNLKIVCVTATGTNNLDKEYLQEHNIEWRNVAGYSTESVAQHTFAMFFYLFEKLRYYDDYVKQEKYVNDSQFTHFANVFHELDKKVWGIVGMGTIGQRVASIAKSFGCKVIYYSTSGKNNQPDYERVNWETLLKESDVVSVHAPLDENTKDLMNYEAFLKMKDTALFLNLGRGAIVVEEDLAKALEENIIAGAGLDVLRAEPMSPDNPLIKIKDSNKLIITPHIGWASAESRTRVIDIITAQLEEYIKNEKISVSGR